MAGRKANQIERAERRRQAEILLTERVGYGDVARTLSERFGCDPRTIRRDITAIYEGWRADGRRESGARLDLAIRAAEREIQRVRRLLLRQPDRQGNEPQDLEYADHFRLSMLLLRWENHLAKLQGLVVGRVEVMGGHDPLKVVCSIPAGPFTKRQDGDLDPDG